MALGVLIFEMKLLLTLGVFLLNGFAPWFRTTPALKSISKSLQGVGLIAQVGSSQRSRIAVSPNRAQ